jgi:hypothetical protein
MALQRRLRKFWAVPGPGFLAVLALLAMGFGGPSGAGTSERVVNDPHTGLAISGFDPVSYFTDAKPVIGKPEYEMTFDDVVWRFRSDGNRAAFAENPAVYQPRYGGHDPVAVGRGVAVDGNPLLWAVNGDRLYLFYSEKARMTFTADPELAVTTADGRWQEVLETLTK